MRDVFYYSKKPNVHPKEQYATNLEDARNKSKSDHFWIINEFCDYTNFDWDFDFDLLPDEDVWAKGHINIWPSQHQKDSGTWLCSKNKSDIKIYRNDVKPINRKPDMDKYKVFCAIKNFDFSWHHDPTEPLYIYVWGNKWIPGEIQPTLEYHVEGATQKKYMGNVDVEPEWDRYKILIPINKESFDFSWRPDPREPAYIYVWGNQWNNAETEPTIEYHVEGATDRKYLDYPVAKSKAEFQFWIIQNNDDLETFDFSWRPNPFNPPQIYQWEDNGPRYVVPNAKEVVLMQRLEKHKKKNVEKYYIKTTLEDLIVEHSNEVFWALNPDINYEKFNFNWSPDQTNFRHINVFGNMYSKNTQTYYVNAPAYILGYKEFNYVEDQFVETIDNNLSMFFVDKGNIESNQRYLQLQEKFPKLQKTRYLNSWVDTINRCLTKSTTKLFWVLSSELDYSEFVFDFYPSPWQEKMVHVFGTQWSHWGNTYMINKETFSELTKYIKVIEHLSALNFVKSKRAKATNILYDIVYIDHGNLSDEDLKKLEPHIVVKYEESYIQTFKKILDLLPDKKENYVWIASTICNYDSFDFSYICDPFAKDQLHVFPSNKQKYGDTFFVNVNKLKEIIVEIDKLEDYKTINFNNHLQVKRLPAPKFITDEDSHIFEVNKQNNFSFPYVELVTKDNINLPTIDYEPISLWDNSTKNIVVLSTGGTKIVVPKEAKKYLNSELYDYPYISTNTNLLKSNPLDIIFLSNGEDNANSHYEHLLKITKNKPNKVKRIDGIDGRVKSFHAAAMASDTPWAFIVFAKLKVDESFDFSWQPDRLRKPKHYIFYAKNPVNGLIYGHQSMCAYNKKIVLETTGKELDFTMEGEHDVVDMYSGVAEFNTSPYATWRTAFREAIKLKYSNTEESQHRLNIWLTIAKGDFAEYCLLGAKDGVNYFNEVNGEFSKLKHSYEWDWLKNYFNNKYA